MVVIAIALRAETPRKLTPALPRARWGRGSFRGVSLILQERKGDLNDQLSKKFPNVSPFRAGVKGFGEFFLRGIYLSVVCSLYSVVGSGG